MEDANTLFEKPILIRIRLWIARSRRGMKAAEGYIGGPEVKSTSFLPARRRSGRRNTVPAAAITVT